MVVSDPTIGPVTAGVPATVTDGVWSPSAGDTYTTNWFSCNLDLLACDVVGSADSNTYTPGAGDANHVLFFAVIAVVTGAAGQNTAYFQGRLANGRTLQPGAYAAAVTAQPLIGVPLAPTGLLTTVGTLHFTIVK